MVIDGNTPDLIDAFGLQLGRLLDIPWEVFQRAGRRKGAWNAKHDDLAAFGGSQNFDLFRIYGAAIVGIECAAFHYVAGGYGFANLDRHKISSEGLCGRVSLPNLFQKAKRNFF